MRPAAEQSQARRRVSLRRRLFVFAAAVLAPARHRRAHLRRRAAALGVAVPALAEEMVSESRRSSVALFQGLQRAADRRAAATWRRASARSWRSSDRRGRAGRDRGAARRRSSTSRRARRAAPGRSASGTPPSTSSRTADRRRLGRTDDAADPEDVFEEHVNAAIGGVERLVANSREREPPPTSAATRRAQPRAGADRPGRAADVARASPALLASRLAAATLRPIQRLTQAARAFGSGHLGHRVEVTSSAELHEMAETFNRMAEALQRAARPARAAGVHRLADRHPEPRAVRGPRAPRAARSPAPASGSPCS